MIPSQSRAKVKTIFSLRERQSGRTEKREGRMETRRTTDPNYSGRAFIRLPTGFHSSISSFSVLPSSCWAFQLLFCCLIYPHPSVWPPARLRGLIPPGTHFVWHLTKQRPHYPARLAHCFHYVQRPSAAVPIIASQARVLKMANRRWSLLLLCHRKHLKYISFHLKSSWSKVLACFFTHLIWALCCFICTIFVRFNLRMLEYL